MTELIAVTGEHFRTLSQDAVTYPNLGLSRSWPLVDPYGGD